MISLFSSCALVLLVVSTGAGVAPELSWLSSGETILSRMLRLQYVDSFYCISRLYRLEWRPSTWQQITGILRASRLSTPPLVSNCDKTEAKRSDCFGYSFHPRSCQDTRIFFVYTNIRRCESVTVVEDYTSGVLVDGVS